MKMLIVLEFEIPNPEAVTGILHTIDPPNLPHFAGKARIVVEPHATELTDWLDA